MTPATIRATRKGLGLSPGELAARLGVSVHTVLNWELGRRRPCCQYMRRELARLGARVQRLQKKGENDE